MDIQRVTELDPTVLQARQVTIDLSLLPQSGTEPILPGGRTILFNLFNHAAFNIVFDRGEMSQDGVSLIWFGHIQGMASSEVTLVVRGKVVTANIRTPGETFYQVRYARDGVHVIYAIDQGAFPSEREPLMVDNLSDFGPNLSMFIPPGETPRSDDGSLIDVMVVYTPAACQYAGGTAAMRSLIELAVAETNTGYANSKVLQRLRLVHTAEVAYSETTTKPFDDALLALRNPADGLMDEVHALRDTFGADMVNLVINRSTSCGLAFQMHTPSAAFEANAFSAVSRICLTGNHGFAHELGHNLGATHERDSGLRGAFRYSFGYQAPDRTFRTIMAYECPGTCPKVNHWSNPDIFYLSQPTGIVHTDLDAADNRLTLNQNRQIAANWRPSVVSRDTPVIILALGQGGEGKMEVLGVEPDHHPNITWIQVPWPAYNAAVGGTHPVLCNLDNDPEDEVVIGLDTYPDAGGWIEIKDDRNTNYAHLDWVRVPWSDYNAANGATFPACGDFDGDGRDEIAIGLGTYPAQGGWVEIKDDGIANYAHLDWIRVPRADYNAANGATYPTAGDFDGDGRDEIAIGLGTYQDAGGWIEIKDDSIASYAHLDWVRVPWSDYNAANGATFPAAGDFDGDGRDEITVGLGTYPAQGGWVEIKDDGNNGYAHLDWTRVPWADYNAANGATFPAAGDFDGDDRDEIVVGLGTYPDAGGWFEVKDDLNAGLGHLSWGRLHWSAYNSTNGETRPGLER